MRLRAKLLTRLPILFMVAILAAAIMAPASASAQGGQVILSQTNQSYFGPLNNGTSWQNLFVQVPSGSVIVIVMDVSSSNNMMGSGLNFDVWRTTDGAWVGRGVAVQNDPMRTRAFVAVRGASSSLNGPLQIVPVNYGAGAVTATISTVWDAVPGSASAGTAPVFSQDGLMSCASSTDCSLTSDGAGRWMAGTVGGGAAVAPQFRYYLLDYPGGFVHATTTLAVTNSARALNLAPGGNVVSGSLSQLGFTMRATQKIIACAGSGLESATASGGRRGNLPGSPERCQTAEGLPTARPYGQLSGAHSAVAAAVTEWPEGTLTRRQLGLELANYKSAGSSGNVDYAIYYENVPVHNGRQG